ncbi:MAG TPA: acetyl-CoA carboxylase biotin carboxyl carrier protein subunit [Vicinamibacterales bacterium]|nr:acetyl-CoA carboxylase biotin carboxyl carrier protein subunit [Vicinamibacterales bacterium]
MTFEVDINGETTVVAIESLGAVGPDGGRFRVTTHAPGAKPGAALILDAARTDLGWLLVFADDGRSADVAVTERAAGECLVQLPRVTLTAVVDGRRFERRSEEAAAGHGEQRVVAPMPGRVARVLVKAGDTVAARQGLVVVEAMKMENELSAPRAGRVKEVAVTEGASVEGGRLLVIVE